MTAHETRPAWTAPNPSSEDLKTCCAAAYQHDAVALILGDSYHPGGPALTRRLADSLGLKCGERVADVASGPGTTALLLAAEYGVTVEGVDLGLAAVAAATARAAAAGLEGRVGFRVGDAERLPLDDASVDAVVCECALCTFPDKAAATAEMARVLKPGGRVGITDVTLDRDRLDPQLATLAGWVACIADAHPAADYCRYLERAGLEMTLAEAHDNALARMIDTIDARLAAYRMINLPALAGLDIQAVHHKVALAARAVADGIAGYSLLVAHKPATVSQPPTGTRRRRDPGATP
jgi:ubiquinone/menaquinone biosynthesis C-methylase UbiE